MTIHKGMKVRAALPTRRMFPELVKSAADGLRHEGPVVGGDCWPTYPHWKPTDPDERQPAHF